MLTLGLFLRTNLSIVVTWLCAIGACAALAGSLDAHSRRNAEQRNSAKQDRLVSESSVPEVIQSLVFRAPATNADEVTNSDIAVEQIEEDQTAASEPVVAKTLSSREIETPVSSNKIEPGLEKASPNAASAEIPRAGPWTDLLAGARRKRIDVSETFSEVIHMLPTLPKPDEAPTFDESIIEEETTNKERRIVIHNPAENGYPVGFVIGDQVFQLGPGETHEVVEVETTTVVHFHRGGEFGGEKVVLEHDSYHFEVTTEGWQLSPAATPGD